MLPPEERQECVAGCEEQVADYQGSPQGRREGLGHGHQGGDGQQGGTDDGVQRVSS